MTDAPATPEWFTRVIAVSSESHFVDVDGASIHYLSWNAHEVTKPGLLFAHGFRAHARWWSFIAPFLMDRYRVYALDFAGMGDSGSRAEYSSTSFSRDIMGVLDHAGVSQPVLVGHSFGGGRVLRACFDNPGRIRRLVIIDSHVHLADESRPRSGAMELKPKRMYATYEQARARFRLVPPQNRAAPYILDYVGHHSLKPVDGGWTWKFDEKMMPRWDAPGAKEVLEGIDVPVALIYGDDSAVVSRQHAQNVARHLRHLTGPIEIPASHHHVLLDQPLSLVSALRALLY
jgi:pimeloyl-ACP methyl ester carboxylesterase